MIQSSQYHRACTVPHPTMRLLLVAGFLSAAGNANAQTFTERTGLAGITHVHATPPGGGLLPGTAFMTGGVAAADFDNDGLTDLVFTRLNETDILYRNRRRRDLRGPHR
jgi:hypothetical protein